LVQIISFYFSSLLLLLTCISPPEDFFLKYLDNKVWHSLIRRKIVYRGTRGAKVNFLPRQIIGPAIKKK
jgi:hypothetical protein